MDSVSITSFLLHFDFFVSASATPRATQFGSKFEITAWYKVVNFMQGFFSDRQGMLTAQDGIEKIGSLEIKYFQ